VDHFRLIAGKKKDCQEVKVVREKNGWQPLAAARQQSLRKMGLIVAEALVAQSRAVPMTTAIHGKL
jgi:hypothetical protein